MVETRAFKNMHLSFSRLDRFERCPLSYRLHYIDKHKPNSGVPLRFGKAVHTVLEQVVREHVDDERTGALPEARVAELWKEAWSESELAGVSLFEEGHGLLRRFVREQGVVDHQDVLAVEKEFGLETGPFTVVGFIDRVDRVDDETVEVIDYKTNRQLFTRDEVEGSLQLSLYALAARKLWPWAKRIKLSYWMLRHGLRQTTDRTPEQLEATLSYVETLGRMTEEATEYPARLNANCIYCEHRRQCPAYADALHGTRTCIAESTDDLEAVGREREELARIIKALHARKDELESVLKAQLKDRDELVLGGTSYRMFSTTKTTHPLERTVEILGRASGMSWAEVIRKIAIVDEKALGQLITEVAGDRARARLLATEFETVAEKAHFPRLWAKASREVQP